MDEFSIILTKEQVVSVITKTGYRDFSMELLESDIRKGAPVLEDGTINLIDYFIWLYDGRYNE